MSIKLTPDQDDAIMKFLLWLDDDHEREMVLEGYPGCGKSFVTKFMLEALKNNNKVIKMLGAQADEIQPVMTATTNKAAKVLSDFVQVPACTIHSLLGLRVQNDYSTGETKLVHNNKSRKLTKHEQVLIIIDEASYIDNYLLKLIRENTFDCKILYIGDRYQLANVKCSKPPVFYQIDNKATLTTSKRFGENSTIANAGQQLRDTIDTAIWKPLPDDGKSIIFLDDYAFKTELENEFNSLQHNCDDARILAWTNRQVQKYNNFIRGQFTQSTRFADREQVMVASSFSKEEVDGNGRKTSMFIPVESILTVSGTPTDVKLTFGDPDIEQWTIPCYATNIENYGPFYTAQNFEDYYHLLKLLSKQAKNHSGNWLYYFQAKENLLDIRPNFATTVYKAQGSTYKRVFIDLNDIGRCTQWEQVARMLHVAITRASDQVIFRGQLPDRYRG